MSRSTEGQSPTEFPDNLSLPTHRVKQFKKKSGNSQVRRT